MNNVARLRKGLSPERKRKIAARTATIVAEERSLQEPAATRTEERSGDSRRARRFGVASLG